VSVTQQSDNLGANNKYGIVLQKIVDCHPTAVTTWEGGKDRMLDDLSAV